MKTLYGLFLLDILLGQFHVEASFGKSYKNYFGGPLQNLQLLDDKLFIGCRNNISVVDRHLNLINVSSTCNISGCENDNKILIAFKEGNASKLLVCGTGNNGLCELRDANDLSNIKLTSPLQISTNIKRPAVALIDNNSGNLTIAVTYGEGIEEKVDSLGLFFTYDYAISTRKLSSPFNLEGDTDTEVKKLALKFYKSEYTPKNYIIYYRSGFQFNNYIYFLTNQKEYVGSPISVSKLARICQNGTAYKTYADIILECVDKETGDTYNLLQNAIIIDAPSNRREKLLVASFTKGDDFENPSGNSVICTGILSDIDRKVVDAKKDYALHYCGENFEREELRRYIIQTRTSECVLNSTEALESDINCGDRIPQITNVIGNKTVYFTLSSKLRLPSSEGQISFLHGSKDVNRNVTLAAGTSNGQIFRMVINNNLDMLMYDKFTVDAGFPIRGIYQSNNDNGDDGEDGDVLFVLSSNKIFRFDSYNCSKYTTCEQTMTAKNPTCGWCVFQGMSTKMKNCPNSWLSSLESCVFINASFTEVLIDGRARNVTITASHLPDEKENYSYKCRFIHSLGILETATVKRNGRIFQCPVPSTSVTGQTEARLQLLVNTSGEDILLASQPFLFYKCANYTKCGDCVKKIDCSWCQSAAKCAEHCGNPGVKEYGNCPKLGNTSKIQFAHSGIETNLTLTVQNIDLNVFDVRCEINNKSTSASFRNVSTVVFPVKLDLTDKAKKAIYSIKVFYGNYSAELDDDHTHNVNVYSCDELGKDCYFCMALLGEYKCGWDNASAVCAYGNANNLNSQWCPAPLIKQISPLNGFVRGGTSLTIFGKNFGYDNATVQVRLEKDCNIIGRKFYWDEDYKKVNLVEAIYCKTKSIDSSIIPEIVTVPVVVVVNGKTSNNDTVFQYKNLTVDNPTPSFGPIAGGTRITFYGQNLGIGNRNLTFLDFGCSDIKSVFLISSGKFGIQCTTQNSSLGVKNMRILWDGAICNEQPVFTYKANPTIETILPTKGFLSGGTNITITGTDMKNAASSEITIKGQTKSQSCTIESPKLTICQVPRYISPNDGGTRRKRDANSMPNKVDVVVNFDGVEKKFEISYFRDPEIDVFENEVLLYGTDKQQLVIKGRYINLVATKDDVKVTIGLEECSVIEVTEFNIICRAPTTQPASRDNSRLPEVNVTIGNIQKRVGYLEYEQKLKTAYIIGGAVAGGFVFIIVIILVIGIYKYRKVGEKARDYQKNLSDMEMEIRRVAREEFLDMHTTMSSVNRNLVEQGFPYHSYQQYACNVMFSVDYLWTEPVVSNGKMTDDERIKANKGMELMESLIYNKFFIVSVISTMEKQKRFFIREKANLAGNLCAVLMGKMDYLEEILKMLLSNLVQETPSKKQKSLFRRCESITEKLLSNWLSLCLYPHIRANSGSPLYLLYIATQKTMESGPIDAILGDAKYTLFEEKLLKKWSSAEEGTQDLKFEAKTLTLNVVVDNGDTIFKCKVLDCDTISQVKSKCMAQIYVNYPASQLNVDPQDLDLEWHEGFGGALRLKDEDNTSKHDGPWVRLNTLAHYNVKDESNMALVDPHGAENREEDYVNLTNVNVDNACNASVDSTEPLHPRDMQNPGALQHWHLVRKEEETSKQGKSAIAELYLNRLFTTKQCLMEYISTLFNIVLEKDRCPPPTKCLFDFLDDLGDRHKIDADTLYTWKSHSYAIRVWASLIKMPSLLFDVNIPNYVEENLDVISQVFIESFSLSSQKFTKDSPSQKLIFHNEMNLYRDKVKEFYKNVKVDSQAQDEYRQYMTEVNKQQQQTNFNKVSALYRLYKQLKPYFEEILEDLTTCKETSNLRLNKKLEEVMEIMEDEEK